MEDPAMKTRLHNDDWGYESNCYVCESRNEHGLRIPFFHDDATETVTAEFELSDTYSGAPTLVHGGVQLAILDEAMAWATIALAHQWALTSRSSAEFVASVAVGVTHSVEASISSIDGSRIDTTARILDPDGTVCTVATASFQAIGEATATRLVGGEINKDHESYLRPNR